MWQRDILGGGGKHQQGLNMIRCRVCPELSQQIGMTVATPRVACGPAVSPVPVEMQTLGAPPQTYTVTVCSGDMHIRKLWKRGTIVSSHLERQTVIRAKREAVECAGQLEALEQVDEGRWGWGRAVP